MTGLKVIDGTPTEISKFIREKKEKPTKSPEENNVCECGHSKKYHNYYINHKWELKGCSECACKIFKNKSPSQNHRPEEKDVNDIEERNSHNLSGDLNSNEDKIRANVIRELREKHPKGFCYICGNANSTIHHLRAEKTGRKTKGKVMGTIPLCRVCHDTLEMGKNFKKLGKAYKRGLEAGQKSLASQNHRPEVLHRRNPLPTSGSPQGENHKPEDKLIAVSAPSGCSPSGDDTLNQALIEIKKEIKKLTENLIKTPYQRKDHYVNPHHVKIREELYSKQGELKGFQQALTLQKQKFQGRKIRLKQNQ